MPLRVSNTVEKNVICVSTGQNTPSPIIVGNNVDTIVLPSIATGSDEYAGRYIQNTGANDCYYAFGYPASPVAYNGILSAGSKQQLDCSNHGMDVHVYSTGGTTIAYTLLKRDDMQRGIPSVIGKV